METTPAITMQRITVPRAPQPTVTIPAPRVPVPAPAAQMVPVPAPAAQMVPVPAPAVPVPTVTIPAPMVTVPALTVTIPAPRGQTTITPAPQVPRPTTRTEAPTPRTTITPTPPQGGILRQFGGAAAIVTVSPQAVTAPKIAITTETGLTILTKLLPIWRGTPEQLQQLVALRYANGTSIIDVKRRDIIIEIIGMLTKDPFDEIMDFLTDAPSAEFVLWEQSSLDEGRIKVEREITIQQAEEVGVRGVGKCRFCPSTELVYAQRQLRSGDEPATVFVRCILCTKQWRQ